MVAVPRADLYRRGRVDEEEEGRDTSVNSTRESPVSREPEEVQ